MNPVDQLKNFIDEAVIWRGDISLKRNQYLIVQGEVNTNLYYVKEGTLRAYVQDGFEEHTIRLAYPENLIVSLDSYISEKPTSLYIQALKKCELQYVTKADFMKLVESKPEVMNLWQFMLEQLILQQFERERDILTSSPKERYERVLARSPQVFQEIPHKHIASYLRMSPETLSRLKKS
ncbi:MAG: Crp/Fnr family transcriptional regulator [Flavobacteriales bacterium]